MKKIVLIAMFLSIFLLSPISASAKTLKEATDEEKVNFFAKHFNFDNFVLVQSRSSDKYAIVPLHGDEVVYSQRSMLNYSTTEWKPVNVPCIYNGFDLDAKTVSGMTNEVGCDVPNILLSSIDILDESGKVVFAKNYDYKKENSGGDTVIDFPYSREEFLLIPFLISLLIVMLFLKWCFPMKGGKKIGKNK